MLNGAIWNQLKKSFYSRMRTLAPFVPPAVNLGSAEPITTAGWKTTPSTGKPLKTLVSSRASRLRMRRAVVRLMAGWSRDSPRVAKLEKFASIPIRC